MNEIQRKIINLRKKINDLNYKYYELDYSEISDYEFDILLHKLIKLENKYPEFCDNRSPTQNLGEKTRKNFKHIHHIFRMYSLDNSYSVDDLYKFNNRIKKIIKCNPEYLCELKYDGVSVSLKYNNGKLVYGATRGDGCQGDDITKNIKTINNIPLKLKKNILDEFYIRGEVILLTSSFNKINKVRKLKGYELYSNPRNTVSGTLKLNDSKQVLSRSLKCFFYSIVSNNFILNTQKDILKFISELGFHVPKFYKYCKNIVEVFKFIELWNKKRYELDYQIDGIVVKVNNLHHQRQLGYTSKAPRWAIAYKFQAEKKETILKSISYQVGRTGIITPVANLEPVILSGSLVKRASLYNKNFIKKLDLHIGDTVLIEKSGEIIPKIIKVILSKRIQNCSKIEFLKFCPECNSKLIQKSEKSNFFCINEKDCFSQIIRKVEHFVSKKAMKIETIGRETIKLLVEQKIIKNYTDLYSLKEEDLLLLKGISKKSIQNILNSIKESIQIPFRKVLFAFGIQYVGEITAEKLAIKFKSIDKLILQNKTDLIKIKDVGIKTATSIVNFFQKKENLLMIESLKKFGIQMKYNDIMYKKISCILEGKNFLFTGKLSQFSREQVKKIVQMHGGKSKNIISKNIDYLVVGENPGNKLKIVRKIPKINILTEDEFLSLISKK